MRINTKRFLSGKVVFLVAVFSFGGSSLQAQIITTIAGNGVTGFSGDSGQATLAELNLPGDARTDDSGNIYIADLYNNRIRKVNSNGIISTVAGGGSSFADGIPATAAYLKWTWDVITDAHHNLYIGDRYFYVSKVDTNGIINTYAGGGGSDADTSIPATDISIPEPSGLAFDTAGNLYVVDQYYDKIHQINTVTGMIKTVVGNGNDGYSGDGGPATAAEISRPYGIAFDKANNMYIADYGNERVRVVNSTTQIITTFAGTGYGGFSGDGGPATEAEMSVCTWVSVDDSGNVYISDSGNNRIRKVNTSGIINTIAGDGVNGYGGDGRLATAAELTNPAGVYVDRRGSVFITDQYNERIRKITYALYVFTTVTNVSCNGGNNGSAIATSGTGIPPYTYSWSSGGNDSTATGLIAGTYKVTVTDAVDSMASYVFIITQPPALTLSDSVINLSCSGVNVGSIIAVPSGGTSPYTYLWSDAGSQTTETAAGLSLGSYTVTVSDSCGVSVTASATISQPDTLIASISTVDNICTGASVTADLSGGASPFTYLWNDANTQTTATASGLTAGSYSVQVSDPCGSTVSASVVITDPPILGVSAIVIANLHCNGINTGSIYASVSGGTSPYRYYWYARGNEYNTATVTGLGAGIYDIRVFDINNCTAIASVTITQPTAITVTTTIINTINICTGGNNGSIYLTVTGGFQPYTYLWSDPNHQTTDTATGLSGGNYTVTVTDSTGCTGWAANTFTVPNTFSDSASAISNISCYGGNNGSATIVVPPPMTIFKNYSFDSAVQHFTVPPDIHTILINIGGAQGGDSLGGYGASFHGECIVNPGEILSVAVGQKGSVLAWAGGGGGASWVYDSTIVLYNPSGVNGLFAVAAGGGGQVSNSVNSIITPGNPGGTNLTSNATMTDTSNSILPEGAGGTGGNGGNSIISAFGYAAGGGCGWLSNGERQGDSSSYGGMDEANHFSMAIGIPGGNGGFGGGGGGGYSSDGVYVYGVGGGGGGYNGGGGSGGGGGSYFINTAPIVTANDTGNGFVIISYTVGGIPPYTYLWSNGETTVTATGLSAGTYSVTVSDSSGCLFTDSVTITQPAAIVPTITEYSGVKCNGDSDAVLFASASGGSGFYQYQWSDEFSQTNSLATGLSIGTYSITVTDNNGCTGIASAIITQPPPINIVADSINATNGNCNGSAWAVVNGGTAPYSYLWTGGLTTDTIINQCVNYYCCTIKDANGCIDSACVNIEATTGTKQLTINNEQLTIFPNPNNGFFTIQLSGANYHPDSYGESVEIYNVLGEKIFQELSIVHYPLSIDLASKPTGMYFYRVIRENGGFIGEGKLVIIK